MSDGEDDPVALLVTRIQQRTDLEQSCRSLHRQFCSRVCNFFRQRGFSLVDAQDLTQDTFIRVFNSIDGLRSSTGFRQWLLKIESNVYRNEVRRRRAHKRDGREVPLQSMTEHGEETPAGKNGPGALQVPPEIDELAGDRERERLRCRLLSEIGQLPVQMRRCVNLRLQDLKYKEIAQVMEISIQTVKAHLHQAQHRLRAKLIEPEDGE